jgi:hypothetical protein
LGSLTLQPMTPQTSTLVSAVTDIDQVTFS